MNTGDQLLRAICEAPAEDTPRLEYADWLDETADYAGIAAESNRAHAELIRLQIGIDRGPDCPLCHKTGRYRGTHKKWCDAHAIPTDATDITPELLVQRECTCDYLRQQRRVTYLLSTSYPVTPATWGQKILKQAYRLKGKDLWAGHVIGISAREYLFIRGFVGIASFSCRSFITSGAKVVAESPLEKVLLSDRVIRTDVPPFGKLGFFYYEQGPDQQVDVSGQCYDRVSAVIPERLFDLATLFRDKDRSEGPEDSYRWLGWAALWWARKQANLPDWTPRPAEAPTFPPLAPGVPAYVFDAAGSPVAFDHASDEVLAWAVIRRDEELVRYKGVCKFDPLAPLHH